MSAIRDGSYTVELNGKEYRLLFSLNALDEIQTKFGGYDKLSEVFRKDNKNWVKDTRWLFTLVLNEGLLAEDENAVLFTEQQIGHLVHMGNMLEMQRAIYASFAVGTAGDGEGGAETDGTEGDGTETGEEAAAQGS